MAQDRSFEGKRNAFRNKYWAIATAGYSDNMPKQDILSICEKSMICLKHTPILKMYTYIQTQEIYWQPGMSDISAMVITTNIKSITWVFIQLIRKSTVPANEGHINDKQQCF